MIKKLSTLLLLLLVTTFLTNCTKSATNPVSVKFRKKNFTKTYDSTAANAENYVHIKIDYIEFTEAATSVAKDSLNKIVEDYISASIFEQKTKTLEQLAESLINDYKKQKREFPDFPGGYELERSVEVLYSNDKLVCVKFNEYSYFGGAHPNSVMFFSRKQASFLVTSHIQSALESELTRFFLSTEKIATSSLGSTLTTFLISFGITT